MVKSLCPIHSRSQPPFRRKEEKKAKAEEESSLLHEYGVILVETLRVSRTWQRVLCRDFFPLRFVMCLAHTSHSFSKDGWIMLREHGAQAAIDHVPDPIKVLCLIVRHVE